MSLVSDDDLSWIAEGKYKSNIDSIVVLYKSEKGVPHNRKRMSFETNILQQPYGFPSYFDQLSERELANANFDLTRIPDIRPWGP